MRYLKFFTILAMCALLFGIQSCSSDKNDEPTYNTYEDPTVVARKDFCKRYNLPEDKILELKENLSFVGKNNIILLTGINNFNEAAVIICDTTATKTLYANFHQLKFDKEVEFSMSYGEKGTFKFDGCTANDIAIDGNNITAAIDGWYFSSNSFDIPRIHYRLFYINGKMSVVKMPQTLEALQKEGKVMSWHEGSSLFYFKRDDSDPNSKVTCYDNKGNFCYEAAYPYYTNIEFPNVYPNYDFLDSDLLQPISNAECLSIQLKDGTITARAANIQKHTLLWQKKDIVIESYEYKSSDRVSLLNKSFSNGVLSFTIEVTTYSGTKTSYKVAVTSDGEVTFPK